MYPCGEISQTPLHKLVVLAANAEGTATQLADHVPVGGFGGGEGGEYPFLLFSHARRHTGSDLSAAGTQLTAISIAG